MNYRKFPKSGVAVSEVSLGAEHLLQVDRATCLDVVSAAIDHNMNYMDLFMSEAFVRDWIGDALKGRREKMMIAGHLGCTQKDGQYYRTRDLAMSEQFFDDLLERLHTDYIDMLMLHYIDDDADADKCLDEKGFLGLARRYLQSGKARMLGFSSHVPGVASRLIATGMFDAMMFSVNPGMDRMGAELSLEDQFGTFGATVGSAATINPQRTALYRQCEAASTGIVVMKGYGAGFLLKEPGMTPAKCIHYALTRPGVSTFAAGCRSVAEVQAAAAYSNATAEERDYTGVLAGRSWNAQGVCMYCNHCLPCPSHIDIAAVTRLLHRAQEGDASAVAEYAALSANGGDCTACGECASRCPFQVDSPGNMAKAHGLMKSEK